jgi:hypothetical protein
LFFVLGKSHDFVFFNENHVIHLFSSHKLLRCYGQYVGPKEYLKACANYIFIRLQMLILFKSP